MNAIVRSIPRLRFSGGGAKVSYLGDQVFVEFSRRILVPAIQPHAYWVADATAGGGTPKISVTPGTHNASIVPTISGTPISPTMPLLSVGVSDTVVYFSISYNSSNIATAIAILSGTSLPTATIIPGTPGTDYKLLSTIAVTVVGSTYTVNCLNDAVSGPQQYLQCGTTSTSTLT